MIKLEIDEKFEELSNLYDLFENITRIDYVPLEYREEIKKSLIKAYKDGNQEFEKIHEKLKRLEQLEKENQKLKKDYNLLDTTMESDDRIICELLKENEQLKNDIKLNETQIDDLTLEVANYKHALEEKNEIIMDLKERLSKYE